MASSPKQQPLPAAPPKPPSEASVFDSAQQQIIDLQNKRRSVSGSYLANDRGTAPATGKTYLGQ